jgi:hypothetical protein
MPALLVMGLCEPEPCWALAGKAWTFRLKFWMNGSPTLKRMYILESTRSYTKTYGLKSGSTLAFYRAPDGRTVILLAPHCIS